MILCPQAQIEQGVGGLSTGILVRATLKNQSLFSCHTDLQPPHAKSLMVYSSRKSLSCAWDVFFFLSVGSFHLTKMENHLVSNNVWVHCGGQTICGSKF